MQEQVQRYLETDRQKQAFLKFEKEVLSQLAKDHSDFAREFYNKMHSNNRDRVREALEDAGKLVEKELQERSTCKRKRSFFLFTDLPLFSTE